jgi:beta-catenin-like protein 1
LDADLIELLAQNLSRLDEEAEADRAGVYYILSKCHIPLRWCISDRLDVLENLASQASIAEKIGQDSNTMSWLLARIQKKERPVSQNQQYSAEILAILLQSGSKTRERFIGLDGVDALLQLLSQYRKRDPEKDSDEEEYAENLFDCLTCLVDDDAGKEKFLEGEGIELAQIMLKEGKFSKVRALRVLDHALGGIGGAPSCERLIEVAGLRTIFGMFMRKVGSTGVALHATS